MPFENEIETWLPKIRHWISSMGRSLSREEQNNVSQEVLLEFWKIQSTLRDASAAGFMLKKIVFKHCHRIYRKSGKFVSLEFDDEILSPGKFFSRDNFHFEKPYFAPLSLQTAIGRKQALAFCLNYHFGFGATEISSIMHISADAVRSALSESRKKISFWQSQIDSEQLPRADVGFLLYASATQQMGALTTILNDSQISINTLVRTPSFKQKYSLLHMAIWTNNSQLSRWLIKHGADPNLRSQLIRTPEITWTPLQSATFEANVDLSERLLNAGAKLDIFSLVALDAVSDVDRILQKKNELVHFQGPDGDYPLHFARSKKMIELLLRHGAVAHSRCFTHERLPIDTSLSLSFPKDAQEILLKATFKNTGALQITAHISARSLYLLGRKDDALSKIMLRPEDFENIFFLASVAFERQDAEFFREWIEKGRYHDSSCGN